MSDSNLGPPEDASLAAIRRARERLFQSIQAGPQSESEERRQSLKRFRRELRREWLKVVLKQIAAGAAFVVPVCLLWVRDGAAHNLLADLPRLLRLILALMEFIPLLVLLAVHGFILWTICRKVRDGARWEMSWGVIFALIFILALAYFIAEFDHRPLEPPHPG
jgi:hypothetical protein